METVEPLYPKSSVYVGCAGWAIPKEHMARFPEDGTHLARYAQRLPAVEINSSFYRPHRPATYARWAASVPEHFRFSVKMPREITHQKRLADVDDLRDRFLAEAEALGDWLGPILVQLPPSLAFSAPVASAFFAGLRGRFGGQVVCEPRHPSWFAPEPDGLLAEFHVARVAADPPPVPAAAQPGGWRGLTYYRLHGSPRIYYSDYPESVLETVAQRLRAANCPAWCIFDNTAAGAAARDALAVSERL